MHSRSVAFFHFSVYKLKGFSTIGTANSIVGDAEYTPTDMTFWSHTGANVERQCKSISSFTATYRSRGQRCLINTDDLDDDADLYRNNAHGDSCYDRGLDAYVPLTSRHPTLLRSDYK